MMSRIALLAIWLAFVPVVASAESYEERQACMSDAFSVCGYAIPDRDRVAACLAQNLNRISLACRTVMLRYSRPSPTQRPRFSDIR
jgi:hypothetical protein